MPVEIRDLIVDPGFWLKLAACLFTIVGMLITEMGNIQIESFATTGVGASHFEGLCFHAHSIILAYVLVSYVLDEKSAIANKFFSGVGAILHLALSALYLKALRDLTWTGSTTLYSNTAACGGVAFIVFLLLTADVVLAFLGIGALGGGEGEGDF